MKKLFLISAVLMGFGVEAQTGFQLNGKIGGLKDGLLYLYYSGPGEKGMKDSAKIVDGSFKFAGSISEPGMAYLSLKEEKRNEANSTFFFLEPAVMQIELVPGSFREAKISGSMTQEQYAELVRAKKQVENKYQKQLDSLRKEKDHEKNAEIRERLGPYFAESDMEDFKFFKKYPASVVTA